jgi:HAE1 family hydrophobic/amphiphilic exporter-1
MSLPELSIKRHVFAWMLSAVIVLFGIIAYQRIGIDRVPSIDFPVLTVTTNLLGADPEVIDTTITSVIESAVNTTPGIEHIASSSSPGVSRVTITFKLGKDIDVAYADIQSKINQIIRRLPTDTDPPTIRKVDTDGQAVIWLSLTGDRTIQQLNLYANNVLKKKFETINGVGEVKIGGRRDRVIRVNLLPDRMAAFQLSATDLLDAFKREHVQLPGGFLVSQAGEQLLKLDLEFHSIKDLEYLIIATRDNAPIYLKDVANVVDGLTDHREIARYNGQPAVGLGVVKIANTNTVEIIDAVIKTLNEDIRPNLPAGMALNISTNDSIFINQLVASLKEHLVEGTLFAALIVLIFMRSFSSTLMICLEIPVSLLGAIAIMYFAGYTFNSMTLLALLLLIGVVVDDAIVVRESIMRHMSGEVEHGLATLDLNNPLAVAAYRVKTTIAGSHEVVFAVIASSLSLICIFAPVIFMDGIMGMFFESFAIVVTFGVLVSLFVSLTLTPMLCSRYLSVTHQENALYLFFGRLLAFLDRQYQKLLALSLAHRGLVLIFTALFVGLTGFYTIKHLQQDFTPESDESYFRVRVKTPPGSSLEYTDSRMQLVEAEIANRINEVDSYYVSIGTGQNGQVNQGMINVRLKPKEKREKSQQTIMDELNQTFKKIPGVKASSIGSSIVRSQRSEKLQFNLTGNHLTELGRIANELQKALSQIDALGKVDLDLDLDLPQLTVEIDRVRAAQMGLNANEIATTISMYVGGLNVAAYNDKVSDGQRYDIRIKTVDSALQSTSDLSKIFLRSSNGELIRLDAVASFKPSLSAGVIARFDLQYAANFYMDPDIPLGDAIKIVNETTKKIIPAQYNIKLAGQAEQLNETIQNMTFVFSLGFILLYMVLASQFNSFLQPVIIMLAQPLAIIGGLIALLMTGNTLNIYSMIGLVLLIGLVAKNSILLVDLTNQLRAKGLSVHEALSEACPVRLRPVLMTSLTIILALLPAAIGLGAGSETNQPLSIAIIGGMVSSTLLTLVVVPAAYAFIIKE